MFVFFHFPFYESQDGTPLHKAAVRGNVEVADLLIRNGAVVNAPDNVVSY